MQKQILLIWGFLCSAQYCFFVSQVPESGFKACLYNRTLFLFPIFFLNTYSGFPRQVTLPTNPSYIFTMTQRSKIPYLLPSFKKNVKLFAIRFSLIISIIEYISS